MNDKELLTKVFAGLAIEDKDHWLDSCDDRQSVPIHYVDLKGNFRSANQEETGDEGFVSIVFSLLVLVRDLESDWVRSKSRNRASPARFGVQMCDSQFDDFAVL